MRGNRRNHFISPETAHKPPIHERDKTRDIKAINESKNRRFFLTKNREKRLADEAAERRAQEENIPRDNLRFSPTTLAILSQSVENFGPLE